MTSEKLQWNYSGRREEERKPGPQEGGGICARDDTTTPPDEETPACDVGFQTIADPPRLPKMNVTSAVETQTIRSRGAGKRASSAPPMSCAVSAYLFSPLPDGCIRLLRLMPHEDEHAPIQCQLFDYPLLDSGRGTHLYEALSYVWGSPEKPRFVTTDEGYLRVTENLHAALLRLRDRSLQRIIWVDAICINQDDTEERNRQVQSMAKIYARANRVLVWLEEATAGGGQVNREATDDSPRALEEIGIAAGGRYTKSEDSETKQQAVLTLLQRSWFRRVWVLQEVAAARHILIMCRSREIDGYAFCSGLNALNLASEDPDTQSRIRSVAYLIKGAILRPKYATSRSDKFSLHIRPLGELLDMYHNREATDRRDKVYALLGMSSDIPVGLLPDYNILWKDLFHQLVKSLIGEQASVETWDEEEIAVIKSQGCVLGKVSSVPSDDAWHDRQNVDIVLKNLSGSSMKGSGRWTIHASATSIQEGDVICLLQGAAKPTIIRLYEDYCAIVAITVTPTNEKGGPAINWPDHLRQKTTFPREFLLVWDWEMSSGRLEDKGDYECFLNSRVSEHAKTELGKPLDKAARLENIGFLLGDSEKYEDAAKKFRKTIEAYTRVFGKEHPHTLAAMDSLAWTYRSQGGEENTKKAEKLLILADLLGRRGDYVEVREDGMVRIAESFDEQVMTILLDRMQDEVQITEGVVKAAAGNEGKGNKVMRLLLDRRGDQIIVTEKVVKAAADNYGNGKEVMRLLLDRRGDQITVTEEMVRTIARRFDGQVMTLLLDRQGDRITITEGVVKAAAGNSKSGKEVMIMLLDWPGDKINVTEEMIVRTITGRFDGQVMALLLDRWGDQITITEEVVKAAAGNYGNAKEVTTLLLDRWGDQITITEEVVKAAAGNSNSGKELMTLLLDRRGDQITVTEEVVRTIAGRFDGQVMKLLLDRQGDQITVTEEVVRTIARRFDGQVMTRLLDRRETRSPSLRRW
ncbi:HET domain protein [Dactylonectria macrodidyma]|uniref:HET domain protein n=1 Tax=Dactylonectria macrodidyma TaxID=307937 RepID=A0A9P9DT20_9HYPO|nr:HET domain protein [Dactylonectria macrodidyma]